MEVNGSDFNLAIDFSSIFFKTMYVNVRIIKNKNNCSAAPVVEVLVCRADRTTKLLLNQANVNRGFQYQKLSESKVLVCKVIVRMCCNLTTTQKMFVKMFDSIVNVFKLELIVTTEKSSIF